MEKSNPYASETSPAKPRLSPAIIPALRKVPQYAAADCVNTHTGAGLAQFFKVNGGANQRHSGCSVTLWNVPWKRRRPRLPALRE